MFSGLLVDANMLNTFFKLATRCYGAGRVGFLTFRQIQANFYLLSISY